MPNHTIVGLLEATYEEEKLNLLNVYANYIKTPKTYTGDIEIAATAHFLGININIVINDNFNYKSYWYYRSIQDTNETINILYINSNHFILLIRKNNIKDVNINVDIKENKKGLEKFIKAKKHQ